MNISISQKRFGSQPSLYGMTVSRWDSSTAAMTGALVNAVVLRRFAWICFLRHLNYGIDCEIFQD
jgi:hypothetical protein